MGGRALKRSNIEFFENKKFFILPQSPLLSATIEDRSILGTHPRRLNMAKNGSKSPLEEVGALGLCAHIIQNFLGKQRTCLNKDFYRGDS